MKRITYISRFAKSLTAQDIADIRRASEAFNLEHGITGYLVSVGATFFQLIEGPDANIDELYEQRIKNDPRHYNIWCLEVEENVQQRMFPDWSMNVFDLNHETELLPRAFRRMVEELVEYYDVLTAYTQPAVSSFLSSGRDPRNMPPQRVTQVVLISDIMDSSHLATALVPEDFVRVINAYSEVAASAVNDHGGTVNKFTGDGVLAIFDSDNLDGALAAAKQILSRLDQLRRDAGEGTPYQNLRAGVGISCGTVVVGNVGSVTKKEYAVIGAAVHRATRLEALTRKLQRPLLVTADVQQKASSQWKFENMGRHGLRGFGEAEEIFAVRDPK